MSTSPLAAETPSTSIEINAIDPSLAALWSCDDWKAVFRLLRRDAPVHLSYSSTYGPFWSITRYDDIVEIERRPEDFSSLGAVTLAEAAHDGRSSMFPMFISMDGEDHAAQRKTVSPALARDALRLLASDARERTSRLLDELEGAGEFDWVDRVASELTTGLLAGLFGMPLEDRRLLSVWAQAAGDLDSLRDPRERRRISRTMFECGAYFQELRRSRRERPGNDLLSHMLSLPEMTGTPTMFLGNVTLLIIGGNDTTRNAMAGAMVALNAQPDQRQLLYDEPALIGIAIAEIIRWQTPLAHMRRTAARDVEFRGKLIAKGSKVALWYASGNRDEGHFERADYLDFRRSNARRHLSFGTGPHRCVGAGLAELQLRILLEEMVKRRLSWDLVAPPRQTANCFGKGYDAVAVRIRRNA